jgi:hypothetical protein
VHLRHAVGQQHHQPRVCLTSGARCGNAEVFRVLPAATTLNDGPELPALRSLLEKGILFCRGGKS